MERCIPYWIFSVVVSPVNQKKENKMKRVLIATLSTVMALGMAGCATSGEGDTALSNADTSVVLTEEQVDKPLTGDQDQLGGGLGDNLGDNQDQTALSASENPDANKDSASSGFEMIPGTWQTASMASSPDGTVTPSHFIKFTEDGIEYGQMKDGAFVKEYTDKITKFDKTEGNGFIVQAESSTGVKYTYKTCATDVNTMEYYETWEESQYSEKYSASGSITKAN